MGRSEKMPVSAGTQKNLWVIPPVDERAEPLARSLKISPLVVQVLLNRGITEAGEGNIFLQPKLTELIRPAQMPGIEPAAARLREAVEKKQKITVYGDYDVDGITGVSILWELLTLLGAQVDYYIPHRIEEGYGLNIEAVRSLGRGGHAGLWSPSIAASAAFEAADLARQLGVDLIVTDHHQPGPALPNAVAIVHPALQESYPNQDSAGAMVAYKLAWAVAEQFSGGQRLEREAAPVHAQRDEPGGHWHRRRRGRSAGREPRADELRPAGPAREQALRPAGADRIDGTGRPGRR